MGKVSALRLAGAFSVAWPKRWPDAVTTVRNSTGASFSKISHRRPHAFRHCGLRLPRKACTPSRWSSVSNSPMNASRSAASCDCGGAVRAPWISRLHAVTLVGLCASHAFGPLECLRQRAAFRRELVHQADAQRGLRVDALAQQHHALRPAFADGPAQPLGAAGAGQQSRRSPSGSAITACGSAMRRSQANAHSRPPPIA